MCWGVFVVSMGVRLNYILDPSVFNIFVDLVIGRDGSQSHYGAIISGYKVNVFLTSDARTFAKSSDVVVMALVALHLEPKV